MTIYDYIREIALTITDNFYYGRKSDINIQADDFAFPAICLIEPDEIGFTVDTNVGNINDWDNVFIQFINKREMGNQASDRITAVNEQRDVAALFVDKVINHPDISVQLQGSKLKVPGVLIVDTYDANVVGIEINLVLSLTYPRGCEDGPAAGFPYTLPFQLS